MNDCIVVMGKSGLYDNAAGVIAHAFEGTLTDVVFVDEGEISAGSGIKGYILASRYCPKLSGLFLKKFIKRYKIKEKKPKEFKESRIRRPVSAHEKCENVLYRFYPKAVVCLTPRTLALTLSAAKTTGYKGCVIAGVYDLAPSQGMSLKGADLYLTGTKKCAGLLGRKGIDKSRILTTGMPVRASAAVREKAMKETGVKQDKPVVLVMGGRYCSGRAMDAAREFAAYSDVIQTVLAGGSRGARGVEKNCPAVIVAGEESVDSLYKIADVAVIAPTAFIVAEVMKNGIPAVILPPVNRAQKAACKALKGVCPVVEDGAAAVKAAMDILMDKTAQEEMKEREKEYVEEGGEERLKAALEGVLKEYKDKDVFMGAELPESDDTAPADEANKQAPAQEERPAEEAENGVVNEGACEPIADNKGRVASENSGSGSENNAGVDENNGGANVNNGNTEERGGEENNGRKRTFKFFRKK